jgi:hypothetical protein
MQVQSIGKFVRVLNYSDPGMFFHPITSLLEDT